MHCNNERRVQQTLDGLANDPTSFSTFLKTYSEQLEPGCQFDPVQLESNWFRFIELSAFDPYTRKNVRILRQGRKTTWKTVWVETAVEICKRRDPEFSLALEDSMTDRFELAVALMENEGKTPRRRKPKDSFEES
jgi:hypothetical protein